MHNFSIKCQHLTARENNIFKKDVTEGRILKSSTLERLLRKNVIFHDSNSPSIVVKSGIYLILQGS